MVNHTLVFALLFLASCGPNPGYDAGPRADAALHDAGGARDGGLAPEAGLPDAGPAATIGQLSGECGVLAANDFSDPEPQLLRNAIDFGEEGFVEARLSPGGAEVLADGNLGGSSIHSEVISHEVLALCDRAELLKTEGEIVYRDPGGKKTDLLLRIDGQVVGVSVTRAVAWPHEAPYPAPQARSLLEDKLGDVLLANANVSEADAWSKQILHIIAYGPEHAERIREAFEAIDAALRADTIVMVTVSDGDDAFLY